MAADGSSCTAMFEFDTHDRARQAAAASAASPCKAFEGGRCRVHHLWEEHCAECAALPRLSS